MADKCEQHMGLCEDIASCLTEIKLYKDVGEKLTHQIEDFGKIVEKLNDVVVSIHKSLVGDLSNKGWLTRIEAVETKQTKIETDVATIKTLLQTIVPWFTAFKWVIVVTIPVIIVGFLAFVWGLLTGKIQIV